MPTIRTVLTTLIGFAIATFAVVVFATVGLALVGLAVFAAIAVSVASWLSPSFRSRVRTYRYQARDLRSGGFRRYETWRSERRRDAGKTTGRKDTTDKGVWNDGQGVIIDM